MNELTKYQCKCSNPECDTIKTFVYPVKANNRRSMCTPCSLKARTKPDDRYQRECVVCGAIKKSKFVIRYDMCQSCARSKVGKTLVLNRKYDEDQITYTYFCATCSGDSSVRVFKARRKSSSCAECARKYCKRARVTPSIYFDLTTMKFITPPNPKRVRDRNTKGMMETVKRTQRPTKPDVMKKPNKIARVSIDKARELTRAHVKEIAAQDLKKAIAINNENYQDKVAEFLATREPSVKASDAWY